MARGVKPRRYDNSRRQALVRATKAQVVGSARELFLENGYAATTIDAISEASDVPQATVYRLFGSKLGILKAVLEVSFVGDDEPVSLHERALVQAAASQRDPRKLLEGYAHVARDVLDRSASLQRILRSAAAADPDAAELLATINEQRWKGQSRIAKGLAERRALRRGLSERQAADLIYAIMSPEIHHLLTVDRGWSADEYETSLAYTLSAALLHPASLGRGPGK